MTPDVKIQIERKVTTELTFTEEDVIKALLMYAQLQGALADPSPVDPKNCRIQDGYGNNADLAGMTLTYTLVEHTNG